MEPLSVVIPCYNEIDSLNLLKYKLAPFLSKANHRVQLIFIDDGSTDGTYESLQTIFADISDKKIVKHPKNMNLGAAVRTGVQSADCPMVAVIDADCSYDPMALFEMCKVLHEQKADCVSASAYHPRGGFTQKLPWYRPLLGQGVCALYNLALARIPFQWRFSYTSIFRVYRRDAISKITFKSNGFLAMAEILARMSLHNFKIIDVPGTSSYRLFGYSKAKIKRLVVEHLIFISQILAHRLLGIPL